MKDNISGTLRMPTWVKIFIGIAVAVAILVVAAAFAGHGPWQHVAILSVH